MYEAAPAPAADATLADLRVDGVTIDGFDPATDSYTVTLAGDVTEYPHITAYAADNAATVTVDQASESNGGKATITVTSADGTASKTVTVDFGSPLAKLARLDVTAPTKTEYQAGEDLDLTGMTVVAVYEKDGKVSAERTIAVDDPELAVSGYDSVVAGEKTVIVSYRGVSATFTVTVKAAPVEPGPEPQPNPDGTTEPSTPEAAGEGSTVANTGASVFGVMIAAVALAAVGIGLVTLRVRRRD